jgi:condensin complex subunit 1
MLEGATGVLARKAASADTALAMIAHTIDSCEALMGTILAALLDMLCSYEHLAVLVCDLCSTTKTDYLAKELIKEIGRLDTSFDKSIKCVAPFISHLAIAQPRLVLANISHILPHLNGDPYYLRSAIVTALGGIVEHIGATAMTISEPSNENLGKNRDSLLQILEERSHDVSSYTRSAVLKAWISIVQASALPIERVIPVTIMAIDRLKDKTVMVRKQALQLLTTLLENNPFLGDLDPQPYRLKLEEMYTYVKNNLPEHIAQAYATNLQEAQENNETPDEIMELERATLAAAIAEADTMDDSSDERQVEFKNKIEALKFAQSALEFIDQYETASSNLHGMLLSNSASDVTEALRFFVKARHFHLPCAVTGMKQALALMWSNETNIQDQVLKAFVEVFISVPGSDGEDPLPADQIAFNLLSLVEQATFSDLASIEEAIGKLTKEGRIPPSVFNTLWVATAKRKSSASAIQILAMAANTDGNIVDSKSRLKTLLDMGLSDQVEETRDWPVARATAMALQRMERTQVDPSCAKYLVLERIMEQLCVIARGDWCNDTEQDTMKWFSAAEEALAALFVIAPEPEECCADIIRVMYQQTFFGDEDSLRLARFFHVLGHISLKLLVYTEALSGSVRRATAKKTLKKQEEADKAKRSANSSSQEEEDIEAELGMAAEIEAENERKVAEIAEKEIVGRGLLSAFGPLLVRVVANEGHKFQSHLLMQTSTLALCKFMCVSSSFCEKHLPVVFSALANASSEDVVLRANTVIALGDLAFRFPNEVEPYTPRLYACLRDPSTKVRRHTLMVLTHLILNDMVKVKGQVCEIALCLRDSDQRMRDTARLLFHELSKRSNNPVYNLLPDIISQLSQVSLPKDDFRSIMAFLLGYIKKERQNEMLLEKLCLRFPKCTTIHQKADIAYCMAQLKVNEKSIKSLVDHFKLYKDALFEEDVSRHFFTLVQKAKKTQKLELKQVLEEWEVKLNAERNHSKENEAATVKAAAAKRRTRKPRQKMPVIESIPEWSGEEDDNESDEEETEVDLDKENVVNSPEPIKQRRSRRGRGRAIATN